MVWLFAPPILTQLLMVDQKSKLQGNLQVVDSMGPTEHIYGFVGSEHECWDRCGIQVSRYRCNLTILFNFSLFTACMSYPTITFEPWLELKLLNKTLVSRYIRHILILRFEQILCLVPKNRCLTETHMVALYLKNQPRQLNPQGTGTMAHKQWPWSNIKRDLPSSKSQ